MKMDVAHAPRDIKRIRFLSLLYYGHRAYQMVISELFGEKQISKIVLYPAINDIGQLADILNRISWYLPIEKGQSNNAQITLGLGSDLTNWERNPQDLYEPDAQKRYITTLDHINFVDETVLDKEVSQADAILLWDTSGMPLLKTLVNLHKIHIIDPNYYSHAEASNYQGLFDHTRTSDQHQKLAELSLRNYNTLLDQVKGCSRATVFGTGPSLDQALEFDFSGGFNIVCNSIVKNRTLLDHIKPQLLVFADPVFHFSPCKYSVEFRSQVLNAIHDYNCFCLVPEGRVTLMLAHYPELKNRIIGMPTRIGIPTRKRDFNFPTPDNFYVKASDNILTLFMLPIASTVAEKIQIIGSDGRQKNENYFWKHSSSAQFDELMQTVFDTHPSFFRDRVYTDYYEVHCKILNNLIEYGESSGKKYISLTQSYIPALEKRHV